MKNRYVFIDEHGDPHLEVDKDGVTNLFISVAVVVEESDLTNANDLALEIFRSNNNKSSKVGGNHQRRINILNRIESIPFKFIALVVNKRRLYVDSGLRFVPSFYKYFNRTLFDTLCRMNSNLFVKADQYRGKRFWEEFHRYFENRIKGKVKVNVEHEFVTSKDEPLVQLADFIAGTLGYCYDPDKKSNSSVEFRNAIAYKELDVEIWPNSTPMKQLPLFINTQPDIDSRLLELNLKRVDELLLKLEKSGGKDEVLQFEILREYLSFEFENMRSRRKGKECWLSRSSALNAVGRKDMRSILFQKRVISPLRKKGVLIAGCQKGYKLVTSHSDLLADLKDDESKILPALQRISESTKALKIASFDDIDLLKDHGNDILTSVIKAFERAKESASLNQEIVQSSESSHDKGRN